MCLMIGKIVATFFNRKKDAKVWSITQRFAFLYTLSVTVLLMLAVGFLYWVLKQNLNVNRYGLLNSKVAVLQRLMREQPQKAQSLASEIEHEADESYPIKYYIRMLDLHGNIELETPGFKEILPEAIFPEPVSKESLTMDAIKKIIYKNQTFLLLAVKLPYGEQGNETKIIQMAVNISTGESILKNYSRKLLIVLILGILFSMVVGSLLAKKGIEPLIKITKSIQGITAKNLKDRIKVSHWPAELSALAIEFNSMLNRLEDAFQRLSQFSAELAHELRTPINNLRGEAEVALTKCRTPEEYQQVLSSSLDEFERLSRMIDNLLFLAWSDNPNAEIQCSLFNARTEIESVCQFYESLAEDRGIKITCNGETLLNGDSTLFRRAISNILDNAICHTHNGGTINISIQPTDKKFVEIRIIDTGEGIAPEHLPKIFERFYKVRSPRSDGRIRIGLGLAIVKSIMNLHKGSVEIQSQIGKGTTVILRFPQVAVSNSINQDFFKD